jgi:hypothetical protein
LQQLTGICSHIVHAQTFIAFHRLDQQLQKIVSFHVLLLAILHVLGDHVHEKVDRFPGVQRESEEFGEFLERLYENELECFPAWWIENVRGDLTEFV